MSEASMLQCDASSNAIIKYVLTPISTQVDLISLDTPSHAKCRAMVLDIFKLSVDNYKVVVDKRHKYPPCPACWQYGKHYRETPIHSIRYCERYVEIRKPVLKLLSTSGYKFDLNFMLWPVFDPAIDQAEVERVEPLLFATCIFLMDMLDIRYRIMMPDDVSFSFAPYLE